MKPLAPLHLISEQTMQNLLPRAVSESRLTAAGWVRHV
jgi:hypothetical protein